MYALPITPLYDDRSVRALRMVTLSEVLWTIDNLDMAVNEGILDNLRVYNGENPAYRGLEQINVNWKPVNKTWWNQLISNVALFTLTFTMFLAVMLTIQFS